TPLSCAFLIIRPPLIPPRFPYTTLFRSWATRYSDAHWAWAPAGWIAPTAARTSPWWTRPPDGSRSRRRITATRWKASAAGHSIRSEEHTSELQSRFDLVCRLLLEKKKTT